MWQLESEVWDGEGLPYEKNGDSRPKIWNKLQEETILGVVQAFIDP